MDGSFDNHVLRIHSVVDLKVISMYDGLAQQANNNWERPAVGYPTLQHLFFYLILYIHLFNF
jgi:hypothetical protein